ncbi:hypothetical protein Ae168Ps1_0640c [Pseudonocardia sp. Ae168_Ps1]|nr:hypothetical protein Ae150APs1_0642c [Pseudonocardia sp. Ae150A_Ps1]OLL78234.1 hypothetical protein Ae168Ps1_0640c [Pseudonocardia sp. Ae168_Ps1]OLL87644.1 hypothetical protein Ae263Ps1_4699 [Pseudonocardia sp. Ae263_Ps1]OLL92329.1 hypothetical protein Ae356Ps1_2226c [Pseudonocardia sp. Ae356_Ps1]
MEERLSSTSRSPGAGAEGVDASRRAAPSRAGHGPEYLAEALTRAMGT